MTAQDILELNNIEYPNFDYKSEDELAQYIEEHKVNDRFIIVTGPTSREKVTRYTAKSDCSIVAYDMDNIQDLFFQFAFVNDQSTFIESDFAKCVVNGGTVLIDDIDFLSANVLEKLIQLTSGEPIEFSNRIYNTHHEFMLYILYN